MRPPPWLLLWILGLAALAPAAGPPYPPSKVITRLTWGEHPIRIAEGAGDNWPIVEGEDGALYTAYGDGRGFGNRVPPLSLGFAKMAGEFPHYQGLDIPSNLDAPMGGGPKGIKASGLLLVDGTMYLFVRNLVFAGDFTNSRLAWSRDSMKTWTWADWHFPDTFGCPEFVQFGRDYRGARDRYVYVVSQDNDNPYRYSPDVVLARVPKGRVADRGQWEFFAGMDPAGQPLWTAEIHARKPAFTDPKGVQRIAITYHRALKRYLLTTSHKLDPKAEVTHTGALGVFDAPEPWGPWTTVYYDDYWSGKDRTYHHKFPTKWMSADGQTLWLLYSGLGAGNYAFCMKKATLQIGPAAPRRGR
jgi:hypothetical protein